MRGSPVIGRFSINTRRCPTLFQWLRSNLQRPTALGPPAGPVRRLDRLIRSAPPDGEGGSMRRATWLSLLVVLLSALSGPALGADAADVFDRVEHHFAENQGVKIHYVTLGKGEP